MRGGEPRPVTRTNALDYDDAWLAGATRGHAEPDAFPLARHRSAGRSPFTTARRFLGGRPDAAEAPPSCHSGHLSRDGDAVGTLDIPVLARARPRIRFEAVRLGRWECGALRCPHAQRDRGLDLCTPAARRARALEAEVLGRLALVRH